jgi:tripartite ATP-independent transporter DctP family solute receptor
MKQRAKLVLFLVIGLFLSVALIGCSSDEANADKSADGKVKTQKLKIAFNQPESHPEFKALEAMGKKIAERTNNAYEIEVFPNELLGAQRETVELVQSGTIAMSLVAGSLMENFNPDFAVLNLPYVYDGKEHQMSVLNNPDIVGDLYKSTEDKNMLVLGSFHVGSRNVYTNSKPVLTPADLKGLKIRVMESDTNIKMMEYMGGTGTPMGQGEVYTAIQSGVLDGGENNELIYADMNHVEVAKYFSYTQHLMIPDYLVINAELFNGMSEEHQAIFKEELQAAIDMEVELWDQDVEAAKKKAEEAGAEFNTVDIKIFQDAVMPLHEEKVQGETAKTLYDKVRAAAK